MTAPNPDPRLLVRSRGSILISLVCQSGRRSLIKPIKFKLNSFDIVMAITGSMLGAVCSNKLISNWCDRSPYLPQQHDKILKP
ncbi:hypothetical protein [Nostoc sp. WHI]|uniref:hypothetical protein n=1 Tax=Nostoc sp. WHI TaxID=2650611 RepID=UPI0018C67D65|nr:hypothetical protein [Nostoc sp. WHI]MBG1268670.1 hypothetical protein [Nostoc sp. WHI]